MARHTFGPLLVAALFALNATAQIPNDEYRTAKQRALQVAADHLDVSAAQLQLIDLQPAQWQDSSLGCPKPGRRYLPSIESGYRAVVRYDKQQYRVHLGENEGVVCTGVMRKGP